ncbi:rhomboid family intramembrane serine protease [Pleionea sediminis]|uniref:rhomboid family intramembrane serine protease n=1 Tax=Pleionea sediminis TaxID=2569479 RepID=UPI0011864F54|nr:rhomboid family intramembrane serine protease [Pleionea sediminis]
MKNTNQTNLNLGLIITFLSLLWVIESAKHIFNLSLSPLGVNPGELSGLIGVIFSPLIHSSWEHLAVNSASVLVLGAALNYGYPKSRYLTLVIIWIVSGVGVWIFGRESYHIGASGLTHGVFYFLFFAAVFRRDKRSIALMFIAVFMHGSMMLGVLPWDPSISFESHLFGGIGGVISAFLFRNIDPKPLRKVYDWELEESEPEFYEPGEYAADEEALKEPVVDIIELEEKDSKFKNIH